MERSTAGWNLWLKGWALCIYALSARYGSPVTGLSIILTAKIQSDPFHFYFNFYHWFIRLTWQVDFASLRTKNKQMNWKRNKFTPTKTKTKTSDKNHRPRSTFIAQTRKKNLSRLLLSATFLWLYFFRKHFTVCRAKTNLPTDKLHAINEANIGAYFMRRKD